MKSKQRVRHIIRRWAIADIRGEMTPVFRDHSINQAIVRMANAILKRRTFRRRIDLLNNRQAIEE